MVRTILKLAFLCVLATATSSLADQIAVNQFKGINNNESSVIIGPEFASDTQNVDVTPGGKSIKKRPGYGAYKTLFTAANQSVHGGFHFFDATGNDVQVWMSSTSVFGIVSDGASTQIVSSATLNSTLDCADTQGSAYCVDSSRDFYIRTNGASLTSWSTSPLGTMVEATPDRVVVAGVSGNLSTLYVSQSNTFTNYSVGPLTTDAFTEAIASPGSKLTHIRWACGKLLWWKDQSFGYFAFEDQFTAQVKIVSDTIGTFDNTSAVDPGGSVWFRGQEGNIWQYDCSGLIKQSIEITPFVQASGRRTANSFTQSSQSDWQTGSSSGTNTLSTTISAGDVVTSSFNVTENSSTQWSLGTTANTTVGTSSISLSTNNSGTVTNPDFESAISGNWTLNQAFVNSWVRQGPAGLSCGTLNPQSGSFMLVANLGGTPSMTKDFQAIDTSNTTLQTVTIPNTAGCNWTQLTLTPSVSNLGKRVKFRFHINDSFNGDTYMTTSDSYIWGGAITFYYNTNNATVLVVDNVQAGSSTITSGQFTSKSYNSGMPYSLNYASATWSVNSSTPAVILQRSSDNSVFYDVTSSTGQNSTANARYYRYLSSFTVGPTENALSALTGVQMIARSSGTYFSVVKNAPSLSAYSTFNPTYSDGDGAHNFFMRSSKNSFNVLSSTPNWTIQSANAIMASTSTDVYFQFIDSFTITSATGTTPTLNDFTANWFDGTATDQAYMLYFDNSIWTSVAYGVGVSSNTTIFKRDLINDGWSIYSFGAGGMLVQNNHLFFGGVPATAKVFQFDSGTSDNGTAINAYWKSKDFTGPDPFLDSQLNQIDVIVSKDQNQSLTATYTTNTSSATSYTISTSSTTQTVVQSRKLLPSGKNGYQFNFKLSDATATSSFEILGYRIIFTPQAYRPGT